MRIVIGDMQAVQSRHGLLIEGCSLSLTDLEAGTSRRRDTEVSAHTDQRSTICER